MPTDTAHVRLRTRQYRLLRWDLGEGIERSTIKVATVLGLPWVLLCWLVGVPFLTLPFLYVLPPALVTMRACSRDAGGRVRLRGWTDRVLRRRRRRPIVAADTAPAAPASPISLDVAFLPLEDGDLSVRRRKVFHRAKAV